MSDDDERYERGMAMYERVYGEINGVIPRGANEMFDLLIVEQQFAEVWSRPGLDIKERRLLTMGVLAATRRFDILQKQFARTLQTGELTPETIREVVLHLIPYVGTPSSGDLWAAATNAIEEHAAATQD
jgi:alkylhydroperoxidase/carboxymuconolactone decarboxylase family protein YurZ